MLPRLARSRKAVKANLACYKLHPHCLSQSTVSWVRAGRRFPLDRVDLRIFNFDTLVVDHPAANPGQTSVHFISIALESHQSSQSRSSLSCGASSLPHTQRRAHTYPATMSTTTTVLEHPRITATNVFTLFPDVESSSLTPVTTGVQGDNELAGYDEEQIRLMNEVCIVLDENDKPIGSASKKTCEFALGSCYCSLTFFPLV